MVQMRFLALMLMATICFQETLSDEESEQAVDTSEQTRQSPIDISLLHTQYCPISFCPLTYSNYWGTNTARVRNTGRTVSITLVNPQPTPTLLGGPLEGEYVFEELHFHWGPSDNEGSEHTLNSRRFAMEAHAVHYKAQYKSLKEALGYKDGVAVVALFFAATDIKIFNTPIDNPGLSLLSNSLNKVNAVNSTTEINPQLALAWFTSRAAPIGFYTYQGSLTTPPYAEAVTWIVYPLTIPISPQQLQEFRNIQTRGNFRSVQPLNRRSVYYCANLLCTQNTIIGRLFGIRKPAK